MYHMTKLEDVVITGGLMREKQNLVRKVTVPYIKKALHNEIPGIIPSDAFENFKIAAGDTNAEFHGLVSQDSDLFKWLEAAALSLQFKDTEMIREQVNNTIALLERAQQKNGYLNTYYIINGLINKWSYLKESCQLYCAGHLIEAAVSHYEVTKDDRLLQIARRYADCIDRDFGIGRGKLKGYDGHAEVELALYRLYEVTKEEKYRESANFFVEERGKKPSFFSIEKSNGNVKDNLVYALSESDFHHSQSHLPVREQKEAVGHAVKAMYFYIAATDKARLDKDQELFRTLKFLWDDVTTKKMYLTGAIGSSEYGESFTYAYDLPADLMYGETCASIGLFFWGYHMLLIENNSKYADIMEKALYNGILCGISEKGTEFFYTNALEIDPERCEKRKDYMHLMAERQSWFECPCCPPNISRLILSLNRYIYTANERELNVHLFVESKGSIDGWKIEQATNYPTGGIVKMKVSNTAATEGILKIRIPDWCEKADLKVDGENINYDVQDGYAILPVVCTKEVEIILDMKMPVVKMYANQNIKNLSGKAAIMKGPVVYCAEQADNGPVYNLYLKDNGVIKDCDSDIIVDGYRCTGMTKELYGTKKPVYDPVKIKLLPYRLWNNRGRGEMRVFFSER